MKHILVIEDEQSIADTICYALRTESFSATWKSLGEEGIIELKQKPADITVIGYVFNSARYSPRVTCATQG